MRPGGVVWCGVQERARKQTSKRAPRRRAHMTASAPLPLPLTLTLT